MPSLSVRLSNHVPKIKHGLVMIHKPAKTSVPINEILRNRWSPRAFDPTKRVSREDIMALCEAARWAPSSSNSQPWRYIVWDRFHNESAWKKGFECLDNFNNKWVQSAPVLILSLAKKHAKDGRFNRHHQHDTGAASISICLQAASMGLQAHQMAGFSKTKLMESFSIPDEFEPMSMIAVGYQSESLDTIPESYHEDELMPRGRNPISLHFFDGQWEKPIIEDIA